MFISLRVMIARDLIKHLPQGPSFSIGTSYFAQTNYLTSETRVRDGSSSIRLKFLVSINNPTWSAIHNPVPRLPGWRESWKVAYRRENSPNKIVLAEYGTLYDNFTPYTKLHRLWINHHSGIVSWFHRLCVSCECALFFRLEKSLKYRFGDAVRYYPS